MKLLAAILYKAGGSLKPRSGVCSKMRGRHLRLANERMNRERRPSWIFSMPLGRHARFSNMDVEALFNY